MTQLIALLLFLVCGGLLLFWSFRARPGAGAELTGV